MLYPVRVDASSKDGQVRIVDSMLIDPSCLPIPPSCSFDATVNKDNPLLNRTIDENSKHLAVSIIADMEVHSCSRIHKSGRVRIFEKYPEMEGLVEAQISSQLRIILEEQNPRKRKRNQPYQDSASEEVSGNVTSKECAVDNHKKELVKVNIRLRENGISIVDELMVDPNHPMSNPLFLAESMAKDLKLPSNIINSLAILISEQLLGLEMKEAIDDKIVKIDEEAKLKATQYSIPSMLNVDKKTPAAWLLSEREQKVASSYFQRGMK
jgi:hypothetical protein